MSKHPKSDAVAAVAAAHGLPFTNVIIRGSWGDVTVERETGTIIRYDDHGKQGWDVDDKGYHDIARFDPATLAPGLDTCLDQHGETDILCVGFVLLDGTVAAPEPEHGGIAAPIS
jgi:hypothetical protein